MIPIAGMAYEFIKWSGRHHGNRWVSGLCQPGMWLQRLTTREPSSDQLEVALQALYRAIALEQRKNSWEIGLIMFEKLESVEQKFQFWKTI